MEREFIATGKTVEEAIEAAYEKAGVDREYVTVEIIERPRKKFLGLKKIPASAKATIDEEYWNKMFGIREKKAEAPKKKKEQKPERTEKAEKSEKQEQPRKEKQEKPKKEQKPQQPRKEQPKKEQKPAEVKAAAEVPAEAKEIREEVKTIAPEVLDKKGGDAAAYIREILVALGYPDSEVTYTQKDGMIVLQLSGDEMGAVVGRRGDNLDAMQYLASLVANKSEGSYIRVVLDIDDYRSKREASLRAYARKMANQAVRGGRSVTLEAMNPYERRIVHSTVQTVSGATSKSIGSEPNRRVVITPTEGAKPFRGERKFRDNKGERKGGRGSRAPRESQKVIVAPSNEPPKNDSSSISLYGRIDLD